jgi:hypothetical protein
MFLINCRRAPLALILAVPLLLVACQTEATSTTEAPPPLNQTVTLLDGSFQIKLPADWRVEPDLSGVGFIDIYSTPADAETDPRRGQVIAITIGRENEAPDGDSIATAVQNAAVLDFSDPDAPEIRRFERDGLPAARLRTPAVDADGTTYYLDIMGYEVGDLHVIMTAFDFEAENAALFRNIFDSIEIEPANLSAALFPAGV